MSFDFLAPPLLVWSQDDFLAQRSGYHVLANYMQCDRVQTVRHNPLQGWAKLRTQLLRKLAISRWCSAGSFELEQKMRRALKSQPQRIVHYLWCDRDLAFIDRMPWNTSAKLVGTMHHPPEMLAQIFRRPHALQRFSAFVLMSQTQASYLTEHGVPTDKVHVILHGVDTDFYKPASKPEIGCFRVLAVGSTGRDFLRLVEVATAFSSDSNILFEIIGPQHQQANFSQMRHVQYRVGVTDAELLKAYQNADVLLHLTTMATANNVLLEAMACALPVIANSTGGVPEYVTEQCALLTQSGSTEEVILALRHLCADSSARASIRHAARAHAETLAWPRVAQRTEALYQSLKLAA
jgi:glycosyltransferase involved in cell wall biosynthesis